MSEPNLKLPNAPIIEAVIDIDCDMPLGYSITDIETVARDLFRDSYPKFRTQFLQEHKIETSSDQSIQVSASQDIQALQFFRDGDRQLVQVRTQGFSFNRLSPYGSLDDYLPEIERTWKLFVTVAAPIQIRTIRLRYINRILLPLTDGQVNLEEYLKVGPRLPDEIGMSLTGFFTQHSAVETNTGHATAMVLTTQPLENDNLPLIFDNSVFATEAGDPSDWPWILSTIQSLRALKNRMFRNTLTPQCLKLFQ